MSPAYDLNPIPLAEKMRWLTMRISEEGLESDLALAQHATLFFVLKSNQAVASKEWQNSASQLGMSAADYFRERVARANIEDAEAL